MKNKTGFEQKKLNHFISLLLGTSLLFGCDMLTKNKSLEETLRDSIVNATGKPASPAQSVLLNTDYLLLYFSAHWCPPCKKFTPELVEFYNTHNGGKNFRVVLISQDHNEKAMYDYMQKAHMPWQAVQFNSACASSLKETYSGDGIPRLVLLNREGEILVDSFEGKTFIGPRHVLKELEKLLPKPLPEFKKEKTPTPSPSAPTPTSTEAITEAHDTPEFQKVAKDYALSGIGNSPQGSIAIINNKIMPEGAILPAGAKIDKITSRYVDLVLKGKRYRLYPKKGKKL